MESALRLALAPIMAKADPRDPIPFLPLICAGDDVTVLLRAKDAIGAAQHFLEAFEQSSEDEFKKSSFPSLRGKHLTACAGVAFVHKAFPFWQAYSLSESLCRYAKDKTKRECSALAFWRVTTSVADEFKDIIARELTTQDDTILTMMPYTTGQGHNDHPRLDDLLTLTDAVEKMPRGSLRGLITEIYSGRQKAQQAFNRIAQVAKARNKESSQKLENLQEALSRLTGQNDESSLWKPLGNKGDKVEKFCTPLHDALELLVIAGQIDEASMATTPEEA